jgi:hypothetical protein
VAGLGHVDGAAGLRASQIISAPMAKTSVTSAIT